MVPPVFDEPFTLASSVAALAATTDRPILWDSTPDARAFLAVVDGHTLALTPDAWARIAASREQVDLRLRENIPVYGLNRGLGSLKDHVLPQDELVAFNQDIWRAHSIVVDRAALSVREVRALMAARVAGMARGVSGAQPSLVQRLIDCLNLGLHPVVRGCGLSVGESDLAPMAQIGCALMGEGEMHFRGRYLPAIDALREAGLEPFVPQPKDGLALISSNTYGSGCGLLMLREALRVFACANTVAALSYEGFSANPDALSTHVIQARDFPSIHACGEVLRGLLEGGVLSRPARTLQDPLSFRCLAQVHGAVYEVLQQATRVHVTMIGCGNDSPMVTPDGLLSNGNFESTSLALAMDQARLGLQRIAIMSTERVHKLLWKEFSGLPTALFPAEDRRNGMFLNNLSRALAATVAEIGSRAMPSGLSATTQITEGMDDYLSLAPTSLERLREQLPLVRRVLAIEALCAVRAVDLRGNALSERLQPLKDQLLPSANRLFATGARTIVARWFEEFPWALAEDLGMPAAARHWLPT